jgi:hypothetical protein
VKVTISGIGPDVGLAEKFAWGEVELVFIVCVNLLPTASYVKVIDEPFRYSIFSI